MGIMVSEGYEALIGACTTEAKAKASAEAIPAGEQLVTNRDVAEVREDFSELRAASMLIVLFACRATVMNLRPPAGFSGKKRARAVSGPHEQKRTRLQGLLCLPILLMCFPPAVYCQAQPKYLPTGNRVFRGAFGGRSRRGSFGSSVAWRGCQAGIG